MTKSTCLTHRDPRALKGALIVARLAAYNATIETPDIDECVEKVSLIIDDDKLLRELVSKAVASAKVNEAASHFCKNLKIKKGVSGYIYHTLPIVLQIFLRYPRDFESAITEAILCGGDTDTVAAILGGMIGAGCGVEGIPNTWVKGIIEWPRSVNWMNKLSTSLVESKINNRRYKPVSINIPGIVLRNIFFMLWVLAHGFRRLLPPY